MTLDFTKLNETQIYQLISNTVTPRPIAWISTLNNGVANLAPFSFFIPLSSNPPTLVVSIGHKSDGTFKDTFANFLENGKATISFVDTTLKDKMTQSAESLPKEQSEFETFDINSADIIDGFPPMVKEAKAALFCTFVKTIEIEKSATTPCLLQIHHAFYADDVIDETYHVNLNNIGRVGGKYLVGGEIVS